MEMTFTYLAKHIRVGYNDSQVNVHRRHDATLKFEFTKLDSLQVSACRFKK